MNLSPYPPSLGKTLGFSIWKDRNLPQSIQPMEAQGRQAHPDSSLTHPDDWDGEGSGLHPTGNQEREKG